MSASCSSVALGPARRCIQSTMPSASMRPEHGAGLHRPSQPLCHHLTVATEPLSGCRHPFTITSPPAPRPHSTPHSPTAVCHGVGAIAIAEEFERGEGIDVEFGAQGCLCHGVHLAQPSHL